MRVHAAAAALVGYLGRLYGGPYRRPSARDIVIASVVSVADVVLFSDLLAPNSGEASSPGWLIILLGTLGGSILVWRRGYPGTALTATFILAAAASLLSSYRPILVVCVMLAAATARCSLRNVAAVVAVALATAAAWLASEVRTSPVATDPATLAVLGAFYVATVVGAMSIGAWQRAAQLERRRIVDRGAEQTRWAIVGERRRMAHELHDIVGNTVTVMIMQAAGARRMIATDPARADDALGKIDELGMQAMSELRRLLSILRSVELDSNEEAVRSDSGDRNPTSIDMASLVDSFQKAGLNIELIERGDRSRLDPSVEIAGTRLLQEALTNSLKHAGQGAQVKVRLDWLANLLEISVESSGGSNDAAGARYSSGSGLAGLTERIMLAGGELMVDPDGPGGFTVSATLPYPDSRLPSPAADPYPHPRSNTSSQPAPSNPHE